jgi:phosphoribosylaminoimidazolecarboxamide formyltransferase / IMP cyclohydrolase
VVNRVTRVDGTIPIRHVLVSAFDKTGLRELVEEVARSFPEAQFYSTGGTYRALEGVLPPARLVSVSDYTGQPEIAGGLVKTLDYKIYLGLLSERYSPEHGADRRRTDAVLFDLVVCNLYPFEAVIAEEGRDLEDARGNIDIGGPTMVRAAAKNYLQTACLTDPADYAGFLAGIETAGGIPLQLRYRLAAKAFESIALYDQAIADYFARTPLPANLYTEAPTDG